MQIWFAPYTLEPRSRIGLSGANPRHGALLKIETLNGVGYADLHPWVELGDWPLAQQLKTLKEGFTSPLSARSLALADLDRVARNRSENAFAGYIIPQSHWLVPDLLFLKPSELHEAEARGFRVLKLKVGRDLAQELAKLSELENELSKFRLRFDFNGSLTSTTYLSFVASLSAVLHDSIEFVEDPLAWSPLEWTKLNEATGTNLAIDRIDESALGKLGELNLKSCPARWIILKPALQNPAFVAEVAKNLGMKIAVTTYLDHPVGQYGAALEAARLNKRNQENNQVGTLGVCGLVSHLAYNANDFSEQVVARGPHLLPTEGAGIGFDDLLEQQPWTRLTGKD